MERLQVIRDIAHIVSELEDMAASEMGNLSYREAASFHAFTERGRRLLDRLLAQPDIAKPLE